MLIEEGIGILKKQSIPFIIVLGYEHYYPKFGLKCQWEGIPNEIFMAMIFDNEKMKRVRGIAKYREECNEAM